MNRLDELQASSSGISGCMDANIAVSHHRAFQIPNVPSSPRQSGPRPNPRGETEKLFTSEFKKLSAQEQSRALNDMHHASGSELNEDPAKIDRLLQDFEEEVGRSKSQIYDQALKQDSSYVEDPAFRLKFIRANLHDVKKAARQMFSFLQHKAAYFGSDKLASDITIDDLTPEDMKILLSGLYHIQDGTDRNGRAILHYFSKAVPDKLTEETMIRANYFIWFNILIPMHSVQKKGLVTVTHELGEPNEKRKTPGLKRMMKILDFMSSLPIRYTANHFCLRREEGSVSWKNVFFGLPITAFPKDAQHRSRFHYGSDTEIQYELAQYGIPLDTFPVDINGGLRVGILNAWCHKYLEKQGGIEEDYEDGASSLSDHDDDDNNLGVENSAPSRARANNGNGQQPPSAPNNEAIEGIWETDVLLGRGRLVQYHPGNIRFRDFLDEHIEEYESLARNQRRRACSDLARELISNGTRFLKQAEGDMWEGCNFEEAVDKVAQFYRTRRRRDNNRPSASR